MKMWEPKSVLCCNLQKGVLTCVIIRTVLMLMMVIACVIYFSFLVTNPNIASSRLISVEIAIIFTIITDCLIWLILCSIFFCGMKKKNSCLFVPFVVWQEVEAALILGIGLILMIVSAHKKQIGYFILEFVITGVLLVCSQCFLFAIRAYHLEMKRMKTGVYVEFRKEEEDEETTTYVEV